MPSSILGGGTGRAQRGGKSAIHVMVMRVVIEGDKVPLGDIGPLGSGDQRAAAARLWGCELVAREGCWKEGRPCLSLCLQEWLLIGIWGFNNRALIRKSGRKVSCLMHRNLSPYGRINGLESYRGQLMRNNCIQIKLGLNWFLPVWLRKGKLYWRNTFIKNHKHLYN